MIVGKITGKSDTTSFSFLVEGRVRKFDYVQVYHKEYEYVLAQVFEIEKNSSEELARCRVIGYVDREDNVKQIRTPLTPGMEVIDAEESFIKRVVSPLNKGAFIGTLEGRDIKVYLDLNKLLSKHVAVIAKTGYGKSYAVSVLIEEILSRGIPVVIIDPHGEYSTLKSPNDSAQEVEALERLGLSPRGFEGVVEYGDVRINKNALPLKMSSSIKMQELVHILPVKLNSSQLAMLYSAYDSAEDNTLTGLIVALQSMEGNAKWSVISTLSYVNESGFFVPDPTPYYELVKPGKCSIINLKGISPDIQQMIVSKLASDLFEERKKGNIHPFFLVVEEAHNFVPERNFGDAKSSSILRTIASEGRKFGMGMCIVTQRPARVEKNVLSQCTTQLILRVTNPGDLRAVLSSVEGITLDSEAEISSLPVGTALITGIVDMPLLVNIRARMSRHIEPDKIIGESPESFESAEKSFKEKKVLPIVLPNISEKDYLLMSGRKTARKELIPACILSLKDKEGADFKVLISRIDGSVIKDPTTMGRVFIYEFLERFGEATGWAGLSSKERKLLLLVKKRSGVKAGSVFMKKRSGGQVSADPVLEELARRGFLLLSGGHYILPSLSMLADTPSYSAPKLLPAEGGILKEKIGCDEIADAIKEGFSVESLNECYILSYS